MLYPRLRPLRVIQVLAFGVCLPHCALGFDATVATFDTESDNDVQPGDAETDAQHDVAVTDVADSDSDAALPDVVDAFDSFDSEDSADVDARGDTADAADSTDVADPTDISDVSDAVDVTNQDTSGDASDASDVDDTDSPDAFVPVILTVTAPEAGNYIVGTDLEIEWTVSGADTVELALVEPGECAPGDTGVVVPSIATLSGDVTSFEWAIPETLAVGTYRVRVTGESVFDEAVECSDILTFEQPPGCETLNCGDRNRGCAIGPEGPDCTSCVDGYVDADGVCERIDCGAPPAAPEQATFASVTTTEFGGVASYSCNAGYSIDGDAESATPVTRRCGATGEWEAESATCEPVDCGALTAPENGSVSTAAGTRFGATASYECDGGFARNGAATRSCSATGEWTGFAPTCDAVDCGPPPAVTNTSVSFTSTGFASIATYACGSGFTLLGGATVACGADGTWSTPPYCLDRNECATSTACTAPGNACANTTGSWLCYCDAGYEGSAVAGANASCSAGPAALGEPCETDSQCPANAWCSTVPGQRRCSPRLFTGAAHQMDFVTVPSGTLRHGSGDDVATGAGFVTASIPRDYFVSRTEVTQGQWRAATGTTDPSCFQSTSGTSCSTSTSDATNNYPVEQLDFHAALAYTNWLSANEGLQPCYILTPSTCADAVTDWAAGDTSCTGATYSGPACTGYRLLSETEWERAARSGTVTNYYWGTATDTATVSTYAWFTANASNRTQPVAQKLPNAYGLYDMSGNVLEWVWDWALDGAFNFIPYPTTVADYQGPETGSARAKRGGSFRTAVGTLRSSARSAAAESTRDRDLGFRVARTARMALGDPCSADSQCPAAAWCSTVPEQRRCAPRLFRETPFELDFAYVPPGTFQQGTTGATNDERPYTATVSRGYFVSRTEITQAQWTIATSGLNPSCFQSDGTSSCSTDNANPDAPVENIDWYAAAAYANWLSVNNGTIACYTFTPSTCADSIASDWGDGRTECTGVTFAGASCPGYRLLSETEWERAARGGTTTTYYWGAGGDFSVIDLYAWYSSNASSRTHAVAQKAANPYGLFDTAGNVMEWTSDWLGSYPTVPTADYLGAASGTRRVFRGGAWNSALNEVRVAERYSTEPSARASFTGFRLARSAE